MSALVDFVFDVFGGTYLTLDDLIARLDGNPPEDPPRPLIEHADSDDYENWVKRMIDFLSTYDFRIKREYTVKVIDSISGSYYDPPQFNHVLPELGRIAENREMSESSLLWSYRYKFADQWVYNPGLDDARPPPDFVILLEIAYIQQKGFTWKFEKFDISLKLLKNTGVSSPFGELTVHFPFYPASAFYVYRYDGN